MYERMYLLLFNAITDAPAETQVDTMQEILKQAQINAEEILIESNEEI